MKATHIVVKYQESDGSKDYEVLDLNGVYNIDSLQTEYRYVSIDIEADPDDVSAAVGTEVEFEVTATGTGLTYQWQQSTDGITWTNSAWTGNKTDTLSRTLEAGDDGLYIRCVITDDWGQTATSEEATITITE